MTAIFLMSSHGNMWKNHAMAADSGTGFDQNRSSSIIYGIVGIKGAVAADLGPGFNVYPKLSINISKSADVRVLAQLKLGPVLADPVPGSHIIFIKSRRLPMRKSGHMFSFSGIMVILLAESSFFTSGKYFESLKK